MKPAVFAVLPSLVVAGILSLASLGARAAPVVTVDDAKAAAAGIRKLPGKRLTLYTDLTGDEIDVLPTVFERAFPQWCKYFNVHENDHPDWHMTGFLMKDKARFAEAGLLPDDLPPFEHGYSWGQMLWLYEQPSDYYRRHLLLHEGTHGFMNSVLGGWGPLWYMEGLAEYLGTHRWQDERLVLGEKTGTGSEPPRATSENSASGEVPVPVFSLTLGYMPKNRDEVPQWGRIRLIQDAVAARRALTLKTVTEFQPAPHRDTDLYAWCWAAATLLDRHPRYQARFRDLMRFVTQPDFPERFRKLFDADWQELSEEWQLMVANLEYGYDVPRSAVDFKVGKPLPAAGGRVTIAADRGWQNTGLRLEAGTKYQLTATGRYQVAKEPKPWLSEPGGVSIRYYQGQPLGVLLAAVRPDHPASGSMSALLKPTVVGLGATFSPTETGTLFLKINDSAGELDDNAGELKVEVRPE